MKINVSNIFNSNRNINSRTKNVIDEIWLSMLIKIISVMTGVLLVPLVIDFLDKEQYGIWLTLSSVFAWFSFFDVGIGNGLRNKLTEALAVNNKELGRQYVSTTYFIVTFIFIFLIIIFQIINPYINWQSILNITSISNYDLYVLTSLVLTFFFLRFIFQLIGVVYIACQKPSANNIIVTLGNLIAFLIILILYYISVKSSLILLGMVLTGIPLLILIFANIYAFKKKYNFLSPKWEFVKKIHIKSLLNLGFKFFVIQIAAILLFSTANIIIVQLFDPAQVVIYASALMYFQLPVMVYGIIMTPIWSAVTDAYAKDEILWLKSALRNFNKISLLFAFGIILMVIISPFIYKVWLGDRVQIPLIITISMALFAIINVFLAPYTNYINGIGKMKLSTYMVLVTFLVYLPMAIFFAKMLNSSAGIMFATCALNITGLYFQPVQVKKLLNKTAKGIWNE